MPEDKINRIKTTAYRYPGEYLILLVTLILVLGVILFTITATACLSGVFILGFVLLSFIMGHSHHQALLRSAEAVNSQSATEMANLVERCSQRLAPGDVNVYITPGRELNAYTFGITSPRALVLYSGLLRVMDEDELLFIIGHEMGHVALGHTWLNSLVGGVAGIPASWSAGALLTMAFLWWNRTCELSADRAGLLACANPAKAVWALIKIGAGGNIDTQAELEKTYKLIDAEDDTLSGTLGEILATHPMLIRRIEALRSYAESDQYRRLLALLDKNLKE